MKILFLHICLCIGLCTTVQSQDFKTTTDLADYINSSFNDSTEKVYQAYKWVTANIRYDTKNALATNHGTDRRAVIDVAFKKRRGVCENFAAIFSDVCSKMGFHAVVIDGLTKQNGNVDRQGHSWSGVLIGGDWFLFDPTWDAGNSGNFHYFKLTGHDFVATHLPFDPLWQMMNYTVTLDEFVAGYYNSKGKTVFNYKDSIGRYLTADTLEQVAGKVDRMEKSGLTNKVLKTFYKIAKGDLEGERQEEQMQWFNLASKLLNECADRLNEFIQFRNNRFLPTKPDSELKTMLNGMDEKIDSAFRYFDKVDASNAVLVYGTGPAREQAMKLKVSYLNQKEFLRKYLAGSVAERMNAFYQ